MVSMQDDPGTAPETAYEDRTTNTPLQKHVKFFDRDQDGIIWPSDTYIGFREIKFGLLLSVLATLVIHGGFSYVTWGSWIPDPCFRLKTSRMHRAKHGSDSEVFTKTGGFDENRFDDVFKQYSDEPHTHLTFWQGVRMVHGNLNPYDPFGWTAAVFEWMTTYLMIWPDDPRGMTKQDIKAVYDGTIFYNIAGRPSKEKGS